MKSAILIPALLCVSIVIGLTGCGSSGVGSASTGANGTSGGGTTGSSGATGPNSVLNGKYAFSFTGSATSSGDFLFMAGSFTADGAGNITTGVEDINIVGVGPTKGAALSGTYTIGADGRGTLNFTSVSQTFKIVVESGNHGQLIRFDSGASGSGTFDLQSNSGFSLASLQGNFVFNWNGNDAGPTNFGAPFSAIGNVSFSAGNATGAADLNNDGIYSQTNVSGTLQAPDANGHGTATITYGPQTFTYGYDIISTNRILLIETDTVAGTVGEADAQSGSFTAASFAGSYAFSLTGLNSAGTVGMVGQIVTAGASGSISSSDAVENSFGGGVVPGTFAGTYAVADTVTSSNIAVNGRFALAVTEPSGAADNFVLYMISPGRAFLMETDSFQLTFGQLVSQTGSPFSSASLSENYGINFFGIDGQGVESDTVGQFTSGGTSTLTAGTLDINDEDLSSPTLPNNPISAGSYNILTNTTGHGTLTFSAATATFSFNFYFVSPGQIFLLETDDRVFVVAIGSALSQPTIP